MTALFATVYFFAAKNNCALLHYVKAISPHFVEKDTNLLKHNYTSKCLV